MQPLTQALRDTIQQLLALEWLDYHDRNDLALGTDHAKLSRRKQYLLLSALTYANELCEEPPK